jgi:hypothetical protein
MKSAVNETKNAILLGVGEEQHDALPELVGDVRHAAEDQPPKLAAMPRKEAVQRLVRQVVRRVHVQGYQVSEHKTPLIIKLIHTYQSYQPHFTPERYSRDISDIPPRHPHFNQTT